MPSRSTFGGPLISTMLGLRSLVRPACAASVAIRRTVVPQSMQGMAAPLKRRLSSAMVHDLTSSLSSLSLRSSTRAISAHRDPHGKKPKVAFLRSTQ